jgi:unsaturated chondroitin disaccharide hydrolase
MKKWADDIWVKIENKINSTSDRIKDSFPHISVDGKYDDNSLDWWTNGYWAGILWLVYSQNKNEKLRKYAEGCEEKLDGVLNEYIKLHHDVGFMWLLSAIANYKFTGNERSRLRGLACASHLASRFNIKGNFIRAWNGEGEVRGWAIIDCMMNIPLLHWGSKELGCPRFKHIAMAHADTVIKEFYREDGSVYHIVAFDSEKGNVVGYPQGQGYNPTSAWSRGQSWALYGFMLSYLQTGEDRYLQASKKSADYFISKLDESYIPLCDFCQPTEPKIFDTSAGAIAANGLIELSKALNDNYYLDIAVKILKALEENYIVWDNSNEAILTGGTVAYDRNRDVPLIYGDYYFMEAILKLRGKETLS